LEFSILTILETSYVATTVIGGVNPPGGGFMTWNINHSIVRGKIEILSVADKMALPGNGKAMNKQR
jgi:hypothetical protein